MKHIFFLAVLTFNVAYAAVQDEHKFLFAGQETETFLLKGGIWTEGVGPHTDYCHDGGVRYEDDCRNRTRTRRLCHSGNEGCWEETYEEYSCEPRAIHWGSLTPCGTLNENSKWIAVTAPVTVTFPKDGPRGGIEFLATFEDKGVFKLTPGLLPAGVIATVAVSEKNDPQAKPEELTKRVNFDVKFRTVKDMLAEFAKSVLVAKVDRENRRLYLTIDGNLSSTDEIVLKLNGKIGYRRSRIDVLELSGRPGGALLIKDSNEKKEVLSRLSRDAKGKLVLEIDLNPVWAQLADALKKSPEVTTTVTKVLDPGLNWFGVTADLKQVFTSPIK
ncbi:MAG: hypothetical protein V4598_05750 [Bdellovibrionota bacterium]